MKVTVKDRFLNVRAGKPSVNAPCYQFLAPGSEIEVDGKLYPGDPYEGIATWMRDEGNNYYWSGGLGVISKNITENKAFQEILAGSFDGQELSSAISYNQLLSLPGKIKANGGKNITIAIVDHPLSAALESNTVIQRPFATGDPLVNYHGNFIFGILAGISNIEGIAAQATIMTLPVYNEMAFSIEQKIIDSLEFIARSPEPMVVNISNGFDPKYDSIISRFSENKILVCAAGLNEELSAGQLRYPARLANVISVGSIGRDKLSIPIHKKVDVLLPDFNFVSFKKPTNYRFWNGDSFATAVVAATIALLIASGEAGFTVSSIRQSLKKYALPVNDDYAFQNLNLLIPQ